MKRCCVALVCASSVLGVASGALAQSNDAPDEPPAAAAPDSTREQYIVRQRDLQHRIDELRNDLSGSHAHLEILSESLLGEPLGGARLAIRHENDMGPMFQLERAVFTLDGVALPATASGPTLYNGTLAPGVHTLTIEFDYRGRSLGLFPYLEGYRLRVRGSQSFAIRPGRGLELRVIGYERGGPATPFEQRPDVHVLTRDVPLRAPEPQ
jgi:hypothetical protein